jgi:hypothetical protein
VAVAGWAGWKSEEDWPTVTDLPTYMATILGDMSGFSQRTAKQLPVRVRVRRGDVICHPIHLHLAEYDTKKAQNTHTKKRLE